MPTRRLPKQFLNFGQQRTFLQATVERLLGLVPADRIVVVVPERHRDVAAEQLNGFSGIEVVDQPRNLGRARVSCCRSCMSSNAIRGRTWRWSPPIITFVRRLPR